MEFKMGESELAKRQREIHLAKSINVDRRQACFMAIKSIENQISLMAAAIIPEKRKKM